MTYGDFKDFSRRTASDRVLRDKAFDIAKNPKYGGYQMGFGSMAYTVFDKKSSETNTSAIRAKEFAGGAAKSEIMANQ